MKIRSVKLTNFRKFDGTVAVDGIEDGVNLLVGENEFGKSSLLEAINGVMFEKARSQSAVVRSFRHFRNETVPEVELAFELEGRRWTIWKRFAYKAGKALLKDADGRRFENEAAEAELQRLIGFEPGQFGIWATLWVRQGSSFGEPDLNETGRHTLQGCLEAQVGTVTGGARGRRIPAAIEAALGEILSSRGPRGRYKETRDKLAEVTDRVAQLEAKRAEIFAHMDALARAKAERRGLAEWDEEAHRAELEALRGRRAAAAMRAAALAAARSEAGHAEERAERARIAVGERSKLAAELAPIEAEIAEAADAVAAVAALQQDAKARVDAAQAEAARLRERQRSVAESGRRLDRVRLALALQGELAGLEAILQRAEALQAELGRIAEAAGRIAATDAAVARIEAAEAGLAAAQAALQAAATTVVLTLTPDGMARVRLNDRPLGESPLSLPVVSRTGIEIDGIGRIVIEPQIEGRDTLIERQQLATQERAAALAAAGVGDLAAARRAAAERRELERRLADLRREIAGLAPGTPARQPVNWDALRARLGEMRGRLGAEREALGLADLPSAEDLDSQIAAIHAEGGTIDRAIDAALAAIEGPQRVLQENAERRQVLERQLAGRCGTLETKQAALAASRVRIDDGALAAEAVRLEEEAARRRQALAALESQQDETIDAIDTRIGRLESASRNHQASLARINTEIVRLATLIEAIEGAGVEESLDAARAEGDRLAAAVRGYEEEVAVLSLLQDVLQSAEREAKARYLAPVVSRVEPYLKMLLPGTDLVMDESLAIQAVRRDGTEEAFGSLSDGTQEQIAVLTRLAFAELLLQQGRPATVILDDALAFSDDDRIERMFDILMQAGRTVQILVLTCRRRLFARLGAPVLELKQVPPA